MIPFTARNIRTWSLLGQRGTFGKTLCDLAGENERLWALTADQGALSGLQRFRAMYPGRCLNFGISEQNAVETAAGLANEGFVPFLAFQAAFAASRCADQVKTCMSYMRRNVKLVGLFAGVSVGDCGPTHYALHDLALFRAFPGMTIVSPADAGETARAVEALLNTEGPAYLRLGGPPNTPVVYREDYEFRLGRAVTLRPGADICLVATGAMVHASLEAAPGIEEATGASVSVVNVHTVKPLDEELVERLRSFRLVASVEEHSVCGGLGGALAERFALSGPPHLILGARDEFCRAGEYEVLLEAYGLTAPHISSRVIETFKEICQ